MDKIGNLALLLSVVGILLFGLLKKVPVFSAFTDGAKDGMRTCASLLPTLLGLFVAVQMLKDSGALELFAKAVAPFMQALGLPEAVAPLLAMKPVSGSGSNAVLASLLETYGPDTFTGRVASVVCAASETALYCVTVYFGCVRMKKTRHTLPAALCGGLTAAVIAPLAVRLCFGSS